MCRQHFKLRAHLLFIFTAIYFQLIILSNHCTAAEKEDSIFYYKIDSHDYNTDIDISFPELHPDFTAASAHKLYGVRHHKNSADCSCIYNKGMIIKGFQYMSMQQARDSSRPSASRTIIPRKRMKKTWKQEIV